MPTKKASKKLRKAKMLQPTKSLTIRSEFTKGGGGGSGKPIMG